MTAVLEPRARRGPARPRAALAREALPPLFTRHMLGVVEADRDRRRAFRETHPRPRRRANGTAHPRIVAAIAAHAFLAGPARRDESRWDDEGGRFDPAVAVRRRNGHKEMKRCSS